MGNQGSAQQIPLAPQRSFPRFINQRFVLDHTTTLRLPFGFWSRDNQTPLALTEVDTGAALFHVSGPKADGKRQLLDRNGVSIVVLHNFPVEYDFAIYVPTPTTVAARADAAYKWDDSLCYIQTNMRPLQKCLRIDYTDPVTREPIEISVEGTWKTRNCTITFARRGVRERIARVYLEPEMKKQIKAQKKNKTDGALLSFCIDIAPGVDAALIVVVCAAVEDAFVKKESGQMIEIPTDEITKQMAERHYARAPDSFEVARDYGLTGFETKPRHASSRHRAHGDDA